jgi:hypothetical protein
MSHGPLRVGKCADINHLTSDIFVGGALPFGVVKVGIDTYEDNVTYSTLNGGYTPNGRVTAVSMLHESMTLHRSLLSSATDIGKAEQEGLLSTASFRDSHWWMSVHQ